MQDQAGDIILDIATIIIVRPIDTIPGRLPDIIPDRLVEGKVHTPWDITGKSRPHQR